MALSHYLNARAYFQTAGKPSTIRCSDFKGEKMVILKLRAHLFFPFLVFKATKMSVGKYLCLAISYCLAKINTFVSDACADLRACL